MESLVCTPKVNGIGIRTAAGVTLTTSTTHRPQSSRKFEDDDPNVKGSCNTSPAQSSQAAQRARQNININCHSAPKLSKHLLKIEQILNQIRSANQWQQKQSGKTNW